MKIENMLQRFSCISFYLNLLGSSERYSVDQFLFYACILCFVIRLSLVPIQLPVRKDNSMKTVKEEDSGRVVPASI